MQKKCDYVVQPLPGSLRLLLFFFFFLGVNKQLVVCLGGVKYL